MITDDPDNQTYPYSITSLADKRDFLQKGDAVKFRVAENTMSHERRAMHVAAVRQFIRAKVESVKDKVYLDMITYRKIFFEKLVMLSVWFLPVCTLMSQICCGIHCSLTISPIQQSCS